MKISHLQQNETVRILITQEEESGDYFTTMWESYKGGEFYRIHSSEFTHTTKREAERQHSDMAMHFMSLGYKSTPMFHIPKNG